MMGNDSNRRKMIMKKKLFAMAATVATMTLGMSFSSFAYYVAPPNNDPGSPEFIL